MSRLASVVLAAALTTVACNPTRLKPGYCHSDKDCAGKHCDVNASWKCVEKGDGSVDGDAKDASDDGDASDASDASDAFNCGLCSDGGVCDFDASRCVECFSNTHCADGGANVCDIDASRCVECLADSDCNTPTKPICNKTTLTCGPCTTDAQCAAKVPTPGICMFHQDGRCATDAETIYVQNSTGCSMVAGAGGTKDTPYCLSQDGVNALTQERALVVMKGPDALTEWSVITTPAAAVTVVGQSGATINPGARIGVRVGAGVVYVRGLKVFGGSNVGILADGTSELHLNGCVVESNAKGGIQVGTLNFDITNTVIAKNGPGMDTGGVTWGGFRISAMGSVPSTTRFLNNTVVQNNPVAFSCSMNVPVVGSIVFGNTSGDGAGCTIVSCCGGDPLLAADYHLTSGSTACMGRLDPTLSARDDIDGQLRASGQMNDCGADEF